jgi:hypothetical protein
VNERNVDALDGILNSNTLFRYCQKLDSRRELAAYLASCGVLAPAGVHDPGQVCEEFYAACGMGLADMQEAVRRLATGEVEGDSLHPARMTRNMLQRLNEPDANP